MADFTVYTYDNIDAVAAVLNGVASIMTGGASNYRDMIRTLGLLGLLIALATYLINPTRMAALSWYGTFMIVYFLLFLPVTRVNIVDVTRLGAARTIENVPAALALTASLSSTVGYKLTTTMETVMQVLPISLGSGTNSESACSSTAETECMFRFSRGGMLFGNKLLGRMELMAREQPPAIDARLEADTAEFISQCTAFDLSQKRISYEAVQKSNNLWGVLADTSPARYVTESDEYKPCPEAYTNLTQRRNVMGDHLVRQLARSLYPSLPLNDAVRRTNSAYRDVASATQVGDAAWDVKASLLQNTVINQTKRGLGRMGLEAGSASAVMLGQAEAATFASTNASFITQSRLAEEALPLIRNGVEAMLYGLFPVAVLVLMVLQGPALVTAIKGFVFAFVWIQLWPPLYALVNYIGQVRSMQALRVIVENSRGASSDAIGVAFANYNNIYNGQISDQAVMGYLIIAVPVIASAVIYGMNSAMGAIGGGTFVGGASRAGEAAGSGNVSMGNVSMGQQSLGPSRVDADVFSHTTTTGTWKYGLAEGGMSSLGGQGYDHTMPFKLSLSSAGIAAMKDSVTERLAQSTSESEQLSNKLSAQYSQMLAENKAFQVFDAKMTAASISKGTADSTGVASGTALQEGASYGKDRKEANTVTDSHGTEGGVSVSIPGIASVGGKIAHSNADTAVVATGVQTGTQTGTTVSTQEAASRMRQFLEQQSAGSGEQSSLNASSTTALSVAQDAARLRALDQTISEDKSLQSSLEMMSKNSATYESNLVHTAIQRLNHENNDAMYVSRMNEATREAAVVGEVREMLVEKGFKQEEVAQLFDLSRNGYTADQATIGAGGRVGTDAANMGAEDLREFVQGMGNTGQFTERSYSTPGGLHKDKKDEVFSEGMSPDRKVDVASVTNVVELNNKYATDGINSQAEVANARVDRMGKAVEAQVSPPPPPPPPSDDKPKEEISTQPIIL
jgi:conjugal transfer mating pair stabilization protein TraG